MAATAADVAESVSQRIGLIRMVVWGGFGSLVAALALVVIAGLVLAGPYAGVPDAAAFLVFEAAAVVGTVVIVGVSVASA